MSINNPIGSQWFVNLLTNQTSLAGSFICNGDINPAHTQPLNSWGNFSNSYLKGTAMSVASWDVNRDCLCMSLLCYKHVHVMPGWHQRKKRSVGRKDHSLQFQFSPLVGAIIIIVQNKLSSSSYIIQP